MLIALAITFTVVVGANDGGALVAIGLRLPALSLKISVVCLVTAVVAGPLLVGTAVAETMQRELVPPGPDSAMVLATGFVVAVVIVSSLSWAGLPTSLTLAVIGGITGAGIGWCVVVSWSTVLQVLVVGLLAPVVGALLSLVITDVLISAPRARYLSTVRRAHLVAYGLQCFAYAVNDGQKVLVLFLAAGLAGGSGELAWWTYPVIGTAFVLGLALGLPKVARGMGTGILSTRPTHGITAEFSAAAAVLGSTAVGTPVSMTQSIAGGLFGAGLRDGYRRLRWRTVRNLAGACALTLPSSAALAAVVGWLMSATSG